MRQRGQGLTSTSAGVPVNGGFLSPDGAWVAAARVATWEARRGLSPRTPLLMTLGQPILKGCLAKVPILGSILVAMWRAAHTGGGLRGFRKAPNGVVYSPPPLC